MINNIPENYKPAFGSLVFMLAFFGLIALILNTFGAKSQNVALKKLQENERVANFINTKPLPENIIHYIDIAKLNLEYLTYLTNDKDFLSSLNRIIESLNFLDKKPFIIPDLSLSNIDIKQEYGPVTLQTYISYEQNYGFYCQKLFSLAQFLVKNNFEHEAVLLLDELVSLKYESSALYIMLSDIYLNQNNKDALLKLQTLIINNHDYFKHNEYGKLKVIEKINETLAMF